jgi:hypothetical protein
MAAGVAQLTTLSMTAGPHSLRAVYGGVGGTYLPSQSASLPYAVNTVSGGGFPSAVNLGAGSEPRFVIASDFNGDGKADLAVVNRSSNDVSILLGNGNGTFQSAVNFAVGTAPGEAAVGDFNDDGKADLAVANASSNNVSMLLGNGDGSFQSALNFTVGTSPQSVAVGDFNGDGCADLAIANYYGFSVSVLLGNGTGTFQPVVNYVISGPGQSIAVADFNADGKADLVTGNGEGVDSSESILMGNGDGTFQNAIKIGDLGMVNPTCVAGDFNNDGRPDFACVSRDARFSVFMGNGDGTFMITTPLNTTWKFVAFSSASLSPLDANADGYSDLAFSTDTGVSVWLGNGNGTFDFGVNYGTGTGKFVSSVTVADFNGDGRPDIATANPQSNNVSVMLGTADVCCRLSIRMIGTGAGKVTSSPAGIDCGFNSCSATFSPGQVVSLIGTPQTTGPASAKAFFAGWTGDADCADGSVTVNASIVCVARFDLPQSNVARLRGDLNGDGKSDILWQHTDGSSAVWLMNGLNLIAGADLMPAGSGWSIRNRGDFNGDGKTDIIWQHSDGSVALWLMNGGSLLSGAILMGPGTGWSVQDVGDLNTDSKSDIVWKHTDGENDLLVDEWAESDFGRGTSWSRHWMEFQKHCSLQ